jgi:NAD(P)-dependent dehydrogenase (short-subunit alcohol dehydrogenase family)
VSATRDAVLGSAVVAAAVSEVVRPDMAAWELEGMLRHTGGVPSAMAARLSLGHARRSVKTRSRTAGCCDTIATTVTLGRAVVLRRRQGERGASHVEEQFPMRFDQRVVIVTGGAKGIGAGCGEVFCREGGKIAVLDRDAVAGPATVDRLNAIGPGQALFLPCDVSQPAPLQAAIEQTARHWGRIDCLINNAGAHPPATTIDDTTIEAVEELLRINFVSTFAAAKFALPYLRKTRGTIINVSSMTAVLGQDRSSAYASTKAAQVGLTKALAVELGSQGIRVNAILPSNIDTPLMRAWAATLDDPESALERAAKLQVFGRMGTPEEIGRIALFLATDDSSFLTGQAIEAEGGASLDY